MFEYQVSVAGNLNSKNPWTFAAASDEDAIAKVMKFKRRVEKLHNMSTSPTTLLVWNGEIQ